MSGKKVYVKLRDAGSIFHDIVSGVSVVGRAPVEIEVSAKVKEAIKGGALVELTDKEYALAIEAAKEGDKEATKASEAAEAAKLKAEGGAPAKSDEELRADVLDTNTVAELREALAKYPDFEAQLPEKPRKADLIAKLIEAEKAEKAAGETE